MLYRLTPNLPDVIRMGCRVCHELTPLHYLAGRGLVSVTLRKCQHCGKLGHIRVPAGWEKRMVVFGPCRHCEKVTRLAPFNTDIGTMPLEPAVFRTPTETDPSDGPFGEIVSTMEGPEIIKEEREFEQAHRAIADGGDHDAK